MLGEEDTQIDITYGGMVHHIGRKTSTKMIRQRKSIAYKQVKSEKFANKLSCSSTSIR
jgi:hypothetical protein